MYKCKSFWLIILGGVLPNCFYMKTTRAHYRTVRYQLLSLYREGGIYVAILKLERSASTYHRSESLEMCSLQKSGSDSACERISCLEHEPSLLSTLRGGPSCQSLAQVESAIAAPSQRAVCSQIWCSRIDPGCHSQVLVAITSLLWFEIGSLTMR